jgi:hypothetical protein
LEARDEAQRLEREERKYREQLRDEIERLKSSVVNKDSQCQSLEEMLKLERERRSAETDELRNLLI